ncbi:MAG: hypothetical protein R3232_07825, partial [Clostridia bacterium]|nr:hypothetical protein [Clostridia bacterium]
MKKTISLIITIFLIAGSLYGCNSRRISTEDDTVSGLLGGFLYDTALRADTKSERDYNKSRSKAILSLMSSVNDAAAAMYSINDGIADYEKHLLKFINKIDDPSNAESLYITNIMEKLTAYRVLLETYEEEARSFLQMKPDTGASEAIIRSYAIGSINDLMVLQDECISFLTNRTGAIYNILIKTSKRQAENLISSSVTLYNKKISGKYVEAQSGIDNIAEIIRYISSADYYASIYYLEKADEGIGELKSGTAAEGVTTGMISDLETIVFDLKNDSVPPAYLVPVPEGNSSSFFTRSVYAADEEAVPLDNAKIILTAVSDIESESETAPLQFEKNLNDSAEKNSRIPARVNDSSYVSAKTSGKSFFSFLADKAGDAVNFIKDTGKDAGIRITIALAQQTIKKFNPDTDSRYAAIINTLISHLADSKAVKESNQVESVTTLIKKDLETLIGENKEAFVSYILTSKAEELLVTFNDWKAGMEGGQDHVYTIKDMVDLLALIGIEASEIQKPDS